MIGIRFRPNWSSSFVYSSDAFFREGRPVVPSGHHLAPRGPHSFLHGQLGDIGLEGANFLQWLS